MEFHDVIRKRRMVRTYQRRMVEREKLERVLDAGRRAPSAGFAQGSAFVVLEGAETQRFWELTLENPAPAPASRYGRLQQAPAVVLALAHRQTYLDRYAEPDKVAHGLADAAAWPVPYWEIDTAFAVMAMLLAAVDEGLGALFFGMSRGVDDVLHWLGVPEGYTPIGALTIGYAADTDTPSPSLGRGRRPVPEVVRWGRW